MDILALVFMLPFFTFTFFWASVSLSPSAALNLPPLYPVISFPVWLRQVIPCLHPPSPHPLGSLCNSCSLADLLPPFFPSQPPPPLTLSLSGRSALHWACSVNHLSLARTLIRYGAAVDLQDNKGETALFLSALHGCYDTARLLLLHGANLELHDRRGRRPIDVAREGMRHQVLELLLAHEIQRGPIPVDTGSDMMWEERALMYSPWVGSQGLPGRSASFSGIIGHRDMTPPVQNDWSMGRVQYPPPQNWRPQLNQSATALVPPRVMGRSPRPISTLQEVTSEDEDRDRHQEVPRAATPHFLSPQPAPRQRSFSCTQHALQRRSSAHQPEPNYLIVSDRAPNEPVERVVVSPPTDAATPPEHQPAANGDSVIRVEQAAVSSTNSEQKSRSERLNNMTDSTQTAL